MAEDTQIESMVTITGAEYVRLMAENAKLREALEWAAVQLGNNNLPAFAHQIRAVLGGEND